MAVTRLAWKRADSSILISSSLLSEKVYERALNEINKQRWGSEVLRRLSSSAGGGEVAASEGKKKSSIFPIRKRHGSIWSRRKHPDYSPSLSGLGNALLHATESINKLFEKLSPSQLLGRFKEKDDCYKLGFYLPGFRKDEVKINVANGVLYINAEHKEEEGDESDDEHWAAYGVCSTSIILPEDAKFDEIKAQMEHGVLNIIVPRIENVHKDVKEIPVH